jgi:hypothetical protein
LLRDPIVSIPNAADDVAVAEDLVVAPQAAAGQNRPCAHLAVLPLYLLLLLLLLLVVVAYELLRLLLVVSRYSLVSRAPVEYGLRPLVRSSHPCLPSLLAAPTDNSQIFVSLHVVANLDCLFLEPLQTLDYTIVAMMNCLVDCGLFVDASESP